MKIRLYYRAPFRIKLSILYLGFDSLYTCRIAVHKEVFCRFKRISDNCVIAWARAKLDNGFIFYKSRNQPKTTIEIYAPVEVLLKNN